MINEQILKGGQSTDAVVKIGNTVHRSMSKNSKYVHKVLNILEQKRYKYAPKFIEIDEQGREVLTFIPGGVPRANFEWTDKRLIKASQMLKEFHNCTDGNELVQLGEVIVHRDFAPWNVIVDNNELVGVIDFDGVEPGRRVEDLAYFLWTFLGLGDSEIEDKKQIERISMLCKSYGYSNGKALVDALLKEQERILAHRKFLADNSLKSDLREFSAERVKIIQKEIKWVKSRRLLIEGCLK